MALEQGGSREAAAPLLGLTPTRLQKLLAIGNEQLRVLGPARVESEEAIEEEKYDAGRLSLFTLRSEARAELALSQRVFKASEQGNWRAAQALLASRFPTRWGKIDRLDAKKEVPEAEVKSKPGLSDTMAEGMRRKILGVNK